jgi:NAD(P)-dependent dehydrogenase (short-subunit alcohol dehydrogenase family)
MKIEASVALVTGANRGLGKALVEALLARGAKKVYAAARDTAKIATVDPRVVRVRLDTTRAEDVAAAAEHARDVTLLINNAGVANSFSVLTTSAAALDADLRTNVLGTLAVIQAFAPVLERAERAAIVNVLSLASLGSFPAFGGYAASKAAAYSATQSVRAALKPRHIEVLAALPGPIDTDMVKDLPIPKSAPADVAAAILVGVERGDEEIFPDPMAQQLGAVWRTGPKDLERALANL